MKNHLIFLTCWLIKLGGQMLLMYLLACCWILLMGNLDKIPPHLVRHVTKFGWKRKKKKKSETLKFFGFSCLFESGTSLICTKGVIIVDKISDMLLNIWQSEMLLWVVFNEDCVLKKPCRFWDSNPQPFDFCWIGSWQPTTEFLLLLSLG